MVIKVCHYHCHQNHKYDKTNDTYHQQQNNTSTTNTVSFDISATNDLVCNNGRYIKNRHLNHNNIYENC